MTNILQLLSYTNFQFYNNIPNSVCEDCYSKLIQCIETRKMFIDKQCEFERKMMLLINTVEIKHEICLDYKTDLDNNIEMLTDVIYEHELSYNENIEKDKETVNKQQIAVKKQQCSICGNFVKNLAEHQKFTHSQAKKNFFCDHCDYGCFFRTKLERHLQKHIPKEFRSLFQCPICSFSCSRKDALKSHLLTMHQSNRQKNHKCPHCKKSFYNASQLNIHIRSVHENIRDYLCQHCGKGFFRVKDLNIHTARHKEKTIKCSECSMLFFCKNDLTRHIKQKHAPASIICTVSGCERKFHTNSQLKLHIKTIHEHLKEYICSFCGSCFGQFNNLKRHIDSVHKALRIHCLVDDCEYSISRKDKYKIHLIKAHKNMDDDTRAKILKNVKYQ